MSKSSVPCGRSIRCASAMHSPFASTRSIPDLLSKRKGNWRVSGRRSVFPRSRGSSGEKQNRSVRHLGPRPRTRRVTETMKLSLRVDDSCGPRLEHSLQYSESVATVLFVASNATAIQFDFATELERLQAARDQAGGSFTLTARWSVSADGLIRLLKEHRPDVVHVLSPGVNPSNQSLMLDRGGQVEYVSPTAFARIFDLPQSKAPSLVVLNTCHSLKHAQAIAPRVGAVVAMRDVIYDSAAIEFATDFYHSLAYGSSVAEAFEQGRQAVARV